MAVKSRIIPVRMTDEMFAGVSECLAWMNEHDKDDDGDRTFSTFIRVAVANKIRDTRRRMDRMKLERRDR